MDMPQTRAFIDDGRVFSEIFHFICPDLTHEYLVDVATVISVPEIFSQSSEKAMQVPFTSAIFDLQGRIVSPMAAPESMGLFVVRGVVPEAKAKVMVK
jgi:hypothetical protein